MVGDQILTGCIYQAENLDNGKKYIGLTTRSLNIRRKEHLDNALIRKIQQPLALALRERRGENFQWSVLWVCNYPENSVSLRENEFLLRKAETYYILNLETLNPLKGYNWYIELVRWKNPFTEPILPRDMTDPDTCKHFWYFVNPENETLIECYFCKSLIEWEILKQRDSIQNYWQDFKDIENRIKTPCVNNLINPKPLGTGQLERTSRDYSVVIVPRIWLCYAGYTKGEI